MNKPPMTPEQQWKELGNEPDEILDNLLQPGRIQQLSPADPLLQLKNNLRINIAWAVLISALYVIVLIAFPRWPVILCISIILTFTAWGGYSGWRLYRNLHLVSPGSQTLLDEMKKHYGSIQAWIRLQRIFALVAYPAGAAGGMMAGYLLFSGSSIASMLQRPWVPVRMLLVTVVLVAAGWWLAKKLLEKTFGEHLRVLKNNIDTLTAAP